MTWSGAGGFWNPRRFGWAVALVALGHWLVAVAMHWLARGSADPPLVRIAWKLRVIDAISYHESARNILRVWREGTAHLSEAIYAPRFCWVLTAWYDLTTVDPLAAAAFNALCFLGIGYLAWRLAALAGQDGQLGRWLALVITLWPTAMIWSILPSKDALALLATLGFLVGLGGLLAPPDPGGRAGWRRWPLALSLVASVFTLVFLRYYLAQILPLLVAPCLLVWLWAAGADWRRTACLVAVAQGCLLLALYLAAPFHADWLVFYGPDAPTPPWELWRPGDFWRANWLRLAILLVVPWLGLLPRLARRVLGGRPWRVWAVLAVVALLLGGMVWRHGGALADFYAFFVNQRHFAEQGGGSLAPRAQGLQGGPLDNAGFLKRAQAVVSQAWPALRDLLFFPFPWHRWPETPSWSTLNRAVSAYGVFWYLLLPGLAAGMIRLCRRNPGLGLTLLSWGVGLGWLYALVVLNRGSLFRLREMVLLPCLVVWSPAPYRWLLARLGLWRRG